MQIGPYVVGGRHGHADTAGAYEVLAIDRGPRTEWPVWQMIVRYDRDRKGLNRPRHRTGHQVTYRPLRSESSP
ncbi:hypothetical protein ACIRQP_41955 [Streptomyces sp. NPDC102274]|uniref:hypothetical protein n=1 Tax=Streptomyces sp. NPDC102274 TaxID=3366151 RepID=UPI00381F06DB